MSRPLHAHLLAAPDPPDHGLLLHRAGPDVRVTTGEDPPDPPDFDVLVAGRPRAERLDASPRLRTLVVPFAGIPPETRDLLLAAAKAVLPMDAALRQGRWSGRGRENPAILLDGATALVLGHGAVGRRVAAALRALGMEVVAVRRRRGEIGVTPSPTCRTCCPVRASSSSASRSRRRRGG